MTSANRVFSRKTLANTAKAAISIGIVALLLAKVPIASILGQLAHTDLLWVVVAFATNFASVSILAWRWKVLLGDSDVRTSHLLGWSLVGIGAGLFLPSSAASDGIKAVLYGRSAKNLGRSVLSTAIGRIFGAVAVVLHVVAGILLWPAARELFSLQRLLLQIAAGLAFLVLVVAAFPWLRRKVGEPHEGMNPWESRMLRGFQYVDETRTDRSRLAVALACSVAAQSLAFVCVWALFRAVHAPIALGPIFALMPIVILGSLAPVSIGGIGVREGVMIGLFTHFHLASAEICIATSLIGYLFVGMLGAAGAGWWILRKRTS